MLRFALVVLLTAGGAGPGGPASGVDGPSRELAERALAEAPQKWAEYEQRAASLQGSGELAQSNTANAFSYQQRFSFKRNSRCSLALNDMEEVRNQERSCYREVDAFNRLYAFRLRSEGPGRPYAVTMTHDAAKAPLPADLVARCGIYKRIATLPLRLNGGDTGIAEIVRLKQLRVVSCKPGRLNGRQVVDLAFDFPKDAGASILSGRLVLEPNAFWFPHRVELDMDYQVFKGKSTTQVDALKYENGDLPIVEQVTLIGDWSYRSGQQNKQLSVWKLDFATPRSLPDDAEFTLGAFGQLEPNWANWPRPTPWWLYAPIAGVTLILAGVLVRRFAGRRAAAA